MRRLLLSAALPVALLAGFLSCDIGQAVGADPEHQRPLVQDRAVVIAK